MYVIGLAPLLVISLLTIGGALLFPTSANYWAIAFIGNFAGAVGDLWMIRQIARFNSHKNVLVEDRKNGMAVYSSDTSAVLLGKQLNDKGVVSSFGTYWALGAAGIFVLSLTITILGPLFRQQLLIGPKAFPLISYNVSEGGGEFSFNFVAPIVAGFFFALIIKALIHKAKHEHLDESAP